MFQYLAGYSRPSWWCCWPQRRNWRTRLRSRPQRPKMERPSSRADLVQRWFFSIQSWLFINFDALLKSSNITQAVKKAVICLINSIFCQVNILSYLTKLKEVDDFYSYFNLLMLLGNAILNWLLELQKNQAIILISFGILSSSKSSPPMPQYSNLT